MKQGPELEMLTTDSDPLLTVYVYLHIYILQRILELYKSLEPISNIMTA